MLKSRTAIMMLATLFGVSAHAEPPAGYELVFSDEFDGDELDTSKWIYRETTRGTVSICLPRNIGVDQGSLRIDLRVEEHDGFPMTCGGVITRERFKYGYFETHVKMDAGYGWHEAFWTAATSDFDLNDQERVYERIEIDAFEHYSQHDEHEFTYGIIEWHPLRGGISRDVYRGAPDLSADFHTFAFEFTPDYINFFFEGKLLRTVDVRHVPHNLAHVWLSCIGTRGPEGVEDGEVRFDYCRIYEIDFQSQEYEDRRRRFVKDFESIAEHVPSAGTDLWIEAERFAAIGEWTIQRDGAAVVLRGATDQSTSAAEWKRIARTTIELPEAGLYRLWVRSKDFENNEPRTRTFRASVAGRQSKTTFGTHGQEGYAWQDGGTFELPAGPVGLELIDRRFFGRCDKLLLTTDEHYQPGGAGGRRTWYTWQHTLGRTERRGDDSRTQNRCASITHFSRPTHVTGTQCTAFIPCNWWPHASRSRVDCNKSHLDPQ
ncbi:MAG: family 16 glycosylhydrolase [Planctomycetota bacterium]